ncbi:MAG: hypothetical protein ACK2US_17650 [Anaerolineae bacterium]|jgi:hypothetical protein
MNEMDLRLQFVAEQAVRSWKRVTVALILLSIVALALGIALGVWLAH